MEQAGVIVVGAGLAGLSAAEELRTRGVGPDPLGRYGGRGVPQNGDLGGALASGRRAAAEVAAELGS